MSFEMLLEIFTSVPLQTKINNGNMDIQMATIISNNTMFLDPSTIVSTYLDSDEIITNYVPNNSILQTAPQTVIKNIGRGVSAEQILQQ